jgi:hypothetical protein
LGRVVIVIVGLTGGEQKRNTGMSEDVQRDIAALVKRNRDEPEQRFAEVAAIKEVNPIPRHRHTNSTTFMVMMAVAMMMMMIIIMMIIVIQIIPIIIVITITIIKVTIITIPIIIAITSMMRMIVHFPTRDGILFHPPPLSLPSPTEIRSPDVQCTCRRLRLQLPL